ncbi:hypothetical protein BB561_003094 [Smittium simulii]|uniref:Uncharacterized protein n=1 Tax=Smittium simulii TaxID=133385 RepID=A0A2T9YN60_9FUNG|nr:hypothetical protein BB561_003094 [Smittium simulii]
MMGSVYGSAICGEFPAKLNFLITVSILSCKIVVTKSDRTKSVSLTDGVKCFILLLLGQLKIASFLFLSSKVLNNSDSAFAYVKFGKNEIIKKHVTRASIKHIITDRSGSELVAISSVHGGECNLVSDLKNYQNKINKVILCIVCIIDSINKDKSFYRRIKIQKITC